MEKINLEKWICSMIEAFPAFKESGKVPCMYKQALADQGLEYKDGEIVKMQEPKFKVGDWVMLDRPVLITKVEDMPYNTYQYWTFDGTWFGNGTNAKLWTIQDAKDGDVLASCFNDIFIYHHTETEILIYYYCSVFRDGSFRIPSGIYEYFNVGLIHPATKEQCDLLFARIRKAGYKWLPKKKQLVKITETQEKEQELTELDKSVLSTLNDVAYQGTFGNPSEDYLLKCWRKIGKQIADDLSKTLSVSEDGHLKSNIKKFIKKLKGE